MISYPSIDPEIVRLGPVAIRWYGVMYLLGFAASYLLVKYQVRKKRLDVAGDDVETLYSYIILGLLIGARLGYVVFYNLSYYLYRPLEVFALWQGGMSFHGGFVGVVVAGILFCRRLHLEFWRIADLIVVTAPIGLGLGRLGNFINAELYGRVTNVAWGMVFPGAGGLPRHPSQLYEFFLEGVVLFTILWTVKDRVSRSGIVTALFMIIYGVFRFAVEFVREPDAHLGLIFGPFTMGQVLSAFMIAAGGCLFAFVTSRRSPESPRVASGHARRPKGA